MNYPLGFPSASVEEDLNPDFSFDFTSSTRLYQPVNSVNTARAHSQSNFERPPPSQLVSFDVNLDLLGQLLADDAKFEQFLGVGSVFADPANLESSDAALIHFDPVIFPKTDTPPPEPLTSEKLQSTRNALESSHSIPTHFFGFNNEILEYNAHQKISPSLIGLFPGSLGSGSATRPQWMLDPGFPNWLVTETFQPQEPSQKPLLIQQIRLPELRPRPAAEATTYTFPPNNTKFPNVSQVQPAKKKRIKRQGPPGCAVHTDFQPRKRLQTLSTPLARIELPTRHRKYRSGLPGACHRCYRNKIKCSGSRGDRPCDQCLRWHELEPPDCITVKLSELNIFAHIIQNTSLLKTVPLAAWLVLGVLGLPYFPSSRCLYLKTRRLKPLIDLVKPSGWANILTNDAPSGWTENTFNFVKNTTPKSLRALHSHFRSGNLTKLSRPHLVELLDHICFLFIFTRLTELLLKHGDLQGGPGFEESVMFLVGYYRSQVVYIGQKLPIREDILSSRRGLSDTDIDGQITLTVTTWLDEWVLRNGEKDLDKLHGNLCQKCTEGEEVGIYAQFLQTAFLYLLPEAVIDISALEDFVKRAETSSPTFSRISQSRRIK